MTPWVIAAVLVAQSAMVTGQVFLKHAMNLTNVQQTPWGRFAAMFAVGVGGMTVYFMLWMGLLKGHGLSQIYPFEALVPVLTVAAAWVVFRERIGWRTVAGLGLITGGIVVVALG